MRGVEACDLSHSVGIEWTQGEVKGGKIDKERKL